MNLDTLINEIIAEKNSLVGSSPKELSEKSYLNDNKWLEYAFQQRKDFYEKNRNLLEQLSEKILQHFPKFNSSQRREVLSTLRKTEFVRVYISTNEHPENSKEWFNEQILFFILHDLGSDTRDAMMGIGALKALSEKHSIDLNEIIQSNLELANDVDWHGMGSTRSVLDQMISMK